jgi:hypothetical protein
LLFSPHAAQRAKHLQLAASTPLFVGPRRVTPVSHHFVSLFAASRRPADSQARRRCHCQNPPSPSVAWFFFLFLDGPCEIYVGGLHLGARGEDPNWYERICEGAIYPASAHAELPKQRRGLPRGICLGKQLPRRQGTNRSSLYATRRRFQARGSIASIC